MSAESPAADYDRARAAEILAGVQVGEALRCAEAFLGSPRRIEPEVSPVVPAAGSHLTAAQLDYLQSRMQPCPPALVTSATQRVMWHDSDGVVNVAHCGPSKLGARIPVVAREATLVLRRALAADAGALRRASALVECQRAVMAATTTDSDPVEIYGVGFETTARALVQHAYLADQTPYGSTADFARGMRDSGIFAVVANTWFWGLQSSTFRRGMIPVALTTRDGGTVRYTTESTVNLRAMKDATIAEAHAVLRRAVEEEGLTVADALRKYDVQQSKVSSQYALLPAGEQPRCLANMQAVGDNRRGTVLAEVVDVFIETFVQLLELVEVIGEPESVEEPSMSSADVIFEVPDMTCSHCTNTITGVLETNGVTVSQIDLDTKRVVAAFPSTDVRDRCFDAIRDRGYTVIPPVAS